jgi:hypothetical protein
MRLRNRDRAAAGGRVTASAPPATRHGYGDTAFEVRCDDAEAARWLEEFVSPWFAPLPPGESSHRIRLTASAAAFAELERAAEGAGARPVACFALDQGVVSLRGFDAGDALVLAEPERECFYRLRGGDVEIVTRPGNRRARLALLRVLRELAAARLRLRTGVLDLHAAAFAIEGRALLLIGPKQSGKTTLLMHALASGKAALIGNDRVFADAGSEPPMALGVPTAVRLRPGTLARHPRLRDGVPPGARPLLFHSGEIAEARPAAGRAAEEPPLALAPFQLTERLGVPSIGKAPISALVFPEIVADEPPRPLEALAAGEAAARLRAGLYGAASLPRPATVFERAPGLRHAPPDPAQLERLARRLPAFRCRLGPRAYAGARGQMLLERLAQLAGAGALA